MSSSGENTVTLRNPVLRIPFTIFAPITVSLPSFGLIFCFFTAVIFQFDQVNYTVCNVENGIPSISAITGIQPQRYFWRVCIALHSTPRFLIGLMYVNYYMKRIENIAVKQQILFKGLVWFNCLIYTIENSCLVLVSYIANVENYPLHEKLFVVFMFTSLIYELTTLTLFKWSNANCMTKDVEWSLKWKKRFFLMIMAFTAGLLFFFIRHRFYCVTNAFSFFSAFEYGIALTNIAFHYTAATDFKGNYWYVGLPEIKN